MASPATVPSDLSAGQVLGGRYELLGQIASGGMATVWLAQVRAASGFRRLVAVKTCLPQLRVDEEFVSMFLDEARLAAMIHHPNVVPTLDLGDDDALYLVMEYVEGERLSSIMKKGAIPPPITLRIVSDALLGLHAAHELRDDDGLHLEVVHRDVSPQNIMLGLDGIARVMDFGIAKARSRATVTQEGVVKGKLSYMAPEQLSSTSIDRRADVFAMGVVLWETLTGRRLFTGSTPQETLSRVLHVPVRPPSEVDPEIPAALDAVVLRALSRGTTDRFGSASEFVDALQSCGVEMARPSELAEFAEKHFGAALRQRREKLLGAAAEGLAAPAAEPGVTVQARPGRLAEPTADRTGVTRRDGATRRSFPRARALAALAGLGVLAVVLAGIALASVSQDGSGDPIVPAPLATASDEGAGAEPPPATEMPAIGATPSSAPAAEDPPAAEEDPPAAADSEAAVESEPRPTSRPRARVRRPQPRRRSAPTEPTRPHIRPLD